MTEIQIHRYLKKGQNLLERALKILQNAPSEKVQKLAFRLPSEIAPTSDNPLRIAFAGQYSAGKSSIIKVMTGREDIEIGAKITTKQVQHFDWNGIIIIDTPGIHTELRPDHDKLTYEAISSADLLVFVITSQLFDSHLADHFRDLAIEHSKAHEMLLVVNKMHKTDGNTPEVQDVIREDLRKVLEPFSPEQLKISFVDAELALNARTETNEDLRKYCQRQSGFDNFFDNFNAFVTEKRVAARYTTSLYTLEQVLQEALATEPSDDIDVDALKELLLQQRREFVDTRIQLTRAVENQIQRTTDKIREEGREVAVIIHKDSNSQTINQGLKASQRRVEEASDALSKVIQKKIEDHVNTLDKRVNQIAESELAKELFPRLEKRAKSVIDEGQVQDNIKRSSNVNKYADVARRFGEFLTKHSFTSTGPTISTNLFKLSQYSGTDVHKSIKIIGHFFGKSFRPWGAVKLAQKLAYTGLFLQVGGAILPIVFQINEDADMAKLESDLCDSRTAVRAEFNDEAHNVELHFDKETGAYVEKAIDMQLTKIDQRIDELNDLQQSRGNLFHHIDKLLKETRELISEMHTRDG